MKADYTRILEKLDNLFDRREYAEAERLLRYWEKEGETSGDDKVYYLAVNEQMGLYRKLGREQDALAAVRKMLNYLDRTNRRMSVEGATALLNAGTVYKVFGKSEEGLSFFDEACFVYEELLRPDDKRLAGLYNNMSSALADTGRLNDALGMCKKALDILSKRGDSEAEEAITYLNMTGIYEKRDGLENAQDEIERCLTAAQKKLDMAASQSDGNYAFVCEKCAPTFGYYGWFLEKEELMRRAREIYERLGAV
ncbi:MAG: tetratricopeptide repeat protein [Lachnospiraceae bacterium]|nr:tetratricopeptide repeat protein [Lachnospiraceae bacterium]